jgi:DNA-binding GntR family transcriptional regulator
MAAQEGTTLGAIYRSVKARLLAGEFAPGEKLRPDALRETYDVSATAMREVFLRLVHERLLSQEEQRGFRVPDADERRLTELMGLRILLESEGAAGSITHGDVEWEAQLYAAHHKLAHIEQKMKDADDIAPFVPIWTRIDWEFHETLLSAGPSEVLRVTHRSIYEQFRQQVVASLSSAGFRAETIPEHAAILDAAVARDIPACQAAIRAHLQTYRDDVRDHLRDPHAAV